MTVATDYGKDTYATDTVRTGRLVSGVMLVAQAAYRRLTTPRGTMLPFIGTPEDAEYGLDLSAYVGRDPKNAEASLPALIRAELTKDDRIHHDVKVTIFKTVTGPSTSFAITIHCTTDGGPFVLKLAVSDVTTELLGIEASS